VATILERFTVLDTYNLVKLGYDGLVLYLSQFLILPAALGTPKNDNCFKSGQKQLKNNHFASLVKICDSLNLLCKWKRRQLKGFVKCEFYHSHLPINLNPLDPNKRSKSLIRKYWSNVYILFYKCRNKIWIDNLPVKALKTF